jgi:hypothetical protein
MNVNDKIGAAVTKALNNNKPVLVVYEKDDETISYSINGRAGDIVSMLTNIMEDDNDLRKVITYAYEIIKILEVKEDVSRKMLNEYISKYNAPTDIN